MVNRRPKLPPWKPPPWTDRADALVRVAHPDFVAVKLGVPVAMVLARRAELGLAAVEQQFPNHR
jgi:hypothetical protein